MTEQERQGTRTKLIEFGFWGVSEPGDPTTDNHDAGTLNDRLQTKLAEDVYLISEPVSVRSLTREVVIFRGVLEMTSVDVGFDCSFSSRIS